MSGITHRTQPTRASAAAAMVPGTGSLVVFVAPLKGKVVQSRRRDRQSMPIPPATANDPQSTHIRLSVMKLSGAKATSNP